MTVFYVGDVSLGKLKDVIQSHTPGATIQVISHNFGLWDELWEWGFRVEVSPCTSEVENSIISDIKEKLNQEKVGVVRLPDMEFL